MSFTERYANSVNCSNLMDDQFHSRAESLMASAFAAMQVDGLGPLLNRVKYGDGTRSESFSVQRNMAQLSTIWAEEVKRKGADRRWLPVPRTSWDMSAYQAFHTKVAQLSLAHWLDDRCEVCEGTGIQKDQHTCPCCQGSKTKTVIGERLLVQCIMDMVSDLEGIFGSHNYRASVKMRQAA